MTIAVPDRTPRYRHIFHPGIPFSGIPGGGCQLFSTAVNCLSRSLPKPPSPAVARVRTAQSLRQIKILSCSAAAFIQAAQPRRCLHPEIAADHKKLLNLLLSSMPATDGPGQRYLSVADFRCQKPQCCRILPAAYMPQLALCCSTTQRRCRQPLTSIRLSNKAAVGILRRKLFPLCRPGVLKAL